MPLFRLFSVCRANFVSFLTTASRAGRTFSRTGRTEVVTVKPTTPLQPLIQSGVKPPSPMLAPEQHPLKPTTPMRPKNAPKTPNSHAQRRWRFQTTGPAGLQGLAAVPVGAGRAWPGFEPKHKHTSAHQAQLVWRAPEGPEGTGGLRGAAPNEVRPPSLAGGRALRRPEHQRRHKQHRPNGQPTAPGTP